MKFSAPSILTEFKLKSGAPGTKFCPTVYFQWNLAVSHVGLESRESLKAFLSTFFKKLTKNYKNWCQSSSKPIQKLSHCFIKPFLFSITVLIGKNKRNVFLSLKRTCSFQNKEESLRIKIFLYLDEFWSYRNAKLMDWIDKLTWFLVVRNQWFSWLRP